MVKSVRPDPVYGEFYRMAVEELGIRDGVILAILVVRLPLFMIVEELKAYPGFTPTAERVRSHDRELRDLPSRPAVAIAGKNEGDIRWKKLYKLQIKILEKLRGIHGCRQRMGGPPPMSDEGLGVDGRHPAS